MPKLRPNIFHSSVTIVINHKGWDKNIPSYTGGWWRMPNSAKLLSRFKAPMYRVLCGRPFNPGRGGGGVIKKCRGRLFISSMGQGQERFQISLYEKHRVALLTSDQKVADSIPAVRRTMCEVQ